MRNTPHHITNSDFTNKLHKLGLRHIKEDGQETRSDINEGETERRCHVGLAEEVGRHPGSSSATPSDNKHTSQTLATQHGVRSAAHECHKRMARRRRATWIDYIGI